MTLERLAEIVRGNYIRKDNLRNLRQLYPRIDPEEKPSRLAVNGKLCFLRSVGSLGLFGEMPDIGEITLIYSERFKHAIALKFIAPGCRSPLVERNSSAETACLSVFAFIVEFSHEL